MGFVTVTPNAAIDTTYLLDRLVSGEINRVAQVMPQPGGKGNNVARVLARLGHRPTATGFAGGHTGAALVDGLRAVGVAPSFVSIDGATRVCLTIVEGESGRTTEIREPGAALTEGDADRLCAHLSGLVAAEDTVVISGSLPPGLAPGTAARLIATAHAAGAFVAFDAGGDVLRAGLEARPNLIKPNQEELADLIGFAVGDPISAVQHRLIGPILPESALVLLSLGAGGALLIGKDRAVRATPPPITPKNTVGCGDALLAGFLDARSRRQSEAAALGHSVAVGTAAALQDAVGVVDITEVERVRAAVCVTVESAYANGEGGNERVWKSPLVTPSQA